MSAVNGRRKRKNVQEGLVTGERLKRHKLATEEIWHSPWDWVGIEVHTADDISKEHLLATCSLSRNSPHPFCPNKFRNRAPKASSQSPADPPAKDGPPDDVIIISEDESPTCSKRYCKKNPNCLNYLGHEKWEFPVEAQKSYLAVSQLGKDPRLENRKDDLPVGLRNLGATCYANAYIQVWFQDLAFRNGVYRCLPPHDKDNSFEDSPIFQLQSTFAALQDGKKKVFNPVKLVESLKLRTSEQQDAQEFSKLFMSHLDNEFQKQSDPSLKSLLSDQFEGQQAYTTTCHKCKTRSETNSNFLELELNLENKTSIDSRLQALLQPEILSGDNQYRCSRCDSLQDATRQVVLRKLPPVLHFSLLRFIFDVSTLERKKSKCSITFPTIIDMNRYLDKQDESPTANVYELRGILLHKGSSAYHGHYEAMVCDARSEQVWHLFNDEVVTRMKAPGVEPLHDNDASSSSKPRPIAKKRRRIDSDDEVVEIPHPPSSQLSHQPFPGARIVTSKDAYMLVYARRETHGPRVKTIPPPLRARSAIHNLNSTHDQAVATYVDKLGAAMKRFEMHCRSMHAILHSWNVVSADQRAVIVSQQAMNEFVSRLLTKSPAKFSEDLAESSQAPVKASEVDVHNANGKIEPPSGPSVDPTGTDISNRDIICEHGKLDPSKSADMKRVNATSYERMKSDMGIQLLPELTLDEVCGICVRETFNEKLYQHRHPKHVAEFELLCDNRQLGNFWVSKAWLKDWRQPKPKMHLVGHDDPPPDSAPYGGHVTCEHGGLCHNITARQRISQEAYTLLQSLFPDWNTFSDATEPCAVCMVAVEMSRGDKMELRKKAEEEKARLKHMHENALNNNTMLLENVPLALVPSAFVNLWRLWILRPTHHPRPQRLDNSSFVCQHGLLTVDPNKGDLDASMCLVRKDDWLLLETFYEAGPAIFMEKSSEMEDNESKPWAFSPSVCESCRIQRKSAYDITEVTVRILSAGDANPTPDTFVSSKPPQSTPTESSQTTLTTYKSKFKVSGPQRQSKRIRSNARRRERRLGISKDMTVKEIKLMLQEELDIPTICQRLFYQGCELHDNGATVAVLGILANDVLDLREEREDVDLLDISDSEHQRSRRRDEGGGFGGTLLGGDIPSDSITSTYDDSGTERTSSPPDMDTAKACSACTFRNPIPALACSMCETPF
ncbi:hypothetical protein OF83DRAFT_1168297 [Amylostereum chailletii]|nr:hypothetical protein OF83DRAFT_1168297 [Amylostereum chailletii]